VSSERLGELLSGQDGDDLWSVLYLAERLADIVRGAVAALEPAVVAKWAFQLAQRFNIFYHHHHILSEQDSRAPRIAGRDNDGRSPAVNSGIGCAWN